jgi:hypothetical protein
MFSRHKKPSVKPRAETPGFYTEALSEAERIRLPKAREVEGIDEEIALLRVRLFQFAKEHPDQLDLLLKGVTLLVRAVATKYRLSPKAKKDLTESLEGIINGIGRGMGLGEFDDATEG